MSRPRTTLLILLFAALAAGLGTTGCNPDTRELLLDPRLPTVEPYAGGAWTKTPVLTCGRSIRGLATWDRDDLLLVGTDGLALRLQAGVARNVDAPTTLDLNVAVAQPGGPAWAASSDGAIYRLDGETWTVEYRSAVTLGDLRRFPDGVLLGVGWAGYGLRRTAAGAWEGFNTGADASLESLWGLAADDCWAAGADGVLAHFDGATWSVERPFGPDDEIYSLTGDASGRLAVVCRDTVRLREEGVWRALPQISEYATQPHVAMVGGQLIAVQYDGWYRWDDAAWLRGGDLPGASIYACYVVGDELVLRDGDGALWRLAGDEPELLLPGLGSIADFETTPDGAVFLTSEGWIVREMAGGWRPEACLAEQFMESGRGRCLLRSAAGELLALTPTGLVRETGGAWEAVDPTEGWQYSAVFPLLDGTLLLADSRGLWSWRSGQRVFLCSWTGASTSLRDIAGESPLGARYLFSDLLARYDGVTLLPVAHGLLADLQQVAHDPVEGALLAGWSGLFKVVDDGTWDITPRCDDRGTPVRAQLLDFVITPAGDWLAWTRSGLLLRRRAGVWRSLDGGEAAPLLGCWPATRGRSVRGVGADEVWLATDSHLLRYRDAAP